MLEVTRMTLRPLGLRTGVNLRSARKYWRSTPALENSSADARPGLTSVDARSRTSSNSISATRGWFKEERRVTSPSPSAWAIPEVSADAAAIASTSLRTRTIE
ncbi:hypothetical protein D3C72_1768790 [compost metagenome]